MIAIVKGIVKFFSERGYGKPFVNCLEAAACSMLRFQGWDVPDDYSKTLRGLTGVPVYDAAGRPQGTDFTDLQIALGKAFPVATAANAFHFGALSWAAIVAYLPRIARRNLHRAVVVVTVDCAKLPPYLRVLVSESYTGNHAFALVAFAIGASQHDPSKQVNKVLIGDPMFKGWAQPPYQGTWADEADLTPALLLNKAGNIRCVFGLRNTAVN